MTTANAASQPKPGTAAAEPLPEVIAGRYRVERLLGRGGWGRVYVAQHVNTGERVALKLLSEKLSEPEFVERFKREMRAPAQIRSEHVVRVLDADVAPELGGAPFFVMEFLQGRDLHQRITQSGPMSAPEAVWVLGQVGKALSRAHVLGLVHRDLKPENIYLHEPTDAPPIVKLLDFGLVHTVKSTGRATPTHQTRDPSLPQLHAEAISAANARLTAHGAMLGTPLYMAPEQIDSSRAGTGAAIDIWALGMIAFELLTGQTYWPEGEPTRIFVQILLAPVKPPSGRAPQLGEKFDRWFQRSCALEVDARWPSISEQLKALADALDVPEMLLTQMEPPNATAMAETANAKAGTGPRTERVPASPAPLQGNERVRRWRRATVLLLLLLVAAAGIALWAFRRETPPDRHDPLPPPTTQPAVPPVLAPPVPPTTAAGPPAAADKPAAAEPTAPHRKRPHPDRSKGHRSRGEYLPAAP